MTALPQIILKLDDSGFEGQQVHPGWRQSVEFLDARNIRCAIGVIGRSLETPKSVYVEWLQSCAANGHELWNHGYYHSRPDEAQPAEGRKGAEFRGMDLTFQQVSLQKTQDLMEERLGVTATTFGAPFNATDGATVEALKSVPDLRTWLFKETEAATDAYVLPRIDAVNIEYPVHVPDFELFKQGIERHLDKEVLTLQGHPRSWSGDPARFEAFCQIIQYLIERGAKFTTPSAYVAQTQSA